MHAGYSDSLNGSNFSTEVVNSIFAAASIILFIGIVLAINRLRRRFSGTGCFELGVMVFLFVVAVDVQIRLFLYQNLLAPIIDALLMPLRKLFGLIAAC